MRCFDMRGGNGRPLDEQYRTEGALGLATYVDQLGRCFHQMYKYYDVPTSCAEGLFVSLYTFTLVYQRYNHTDY